MPLVTKQLREGPYCSYRILAVAERTPEGRLSCPVIEFFQLARSREPEDLARISAALTYTARNGPLKNQAKFKHLAGSEHIFEFRSRHGLRLYCFFDSDHVIVCTNGLIKKGNATPQEEIRAAETWRRRYLQAKASATLLHEPEHPQ